MNYIYVARHGETEYNRLGKYTGRTDIPLNENGIKQAEQLAEKLKNEKIDIAVCSSLLRAKQTAEIILENRNIKLIAEDGLKEIGMGVLEGKNIKATGYSFSEGLGGQNSRNGRKLCRS